MAPEPGAPTSMLKSLRRIVQEVVLLEAKLRAEFAQHVEPAQGATAKALSLMAWALLGLDSRPALRSQIDKQAMAAHDSIAAFSHLIAGRLTDLSPLLTGLDVKITRLAHGVPVGGELDYLDEGTLSAAIRARTTI